MRSQLSAKSLEDMGSFQLPPIDHSSHLHPMCQDRGLLDFRAEKVNVSMETGSLIG
jgi:hypothetical protein